MPEHQQVHATTEPQAAYTITRIAGPETARLLGVPIGTPVESRDLHIVPPSNDETEV